LSNALSRRRFITISAGVVTASLVPGAASMASPSSVRWQGQAMGAEASLILNHPDQQKAEAALQVVQDEISRLEKVFSLYDHGSALSALNRAGLLNQPPLDLVRCLDDAAHISRLTNGAFDVTVQPLWDLYARHFAASPAPLSGPTATDIAGATKLVDFNAVHFDARSVSLAKSGMKVTLNGIAQGFITDRVGELLRAQGFDNLLISLGETRGFGGRVDGSDWRVGIKAADGSGRITQKIDLRDKAIATSGGYGTRFSSDGHYHHLFNPKTGKSANRWASISVIADDATRADALSTAFSNLPEAAIRTIAKRLKVTVYASAGPSAAPELIS